MKADALVARPQPLRHQRRHRRSPGRPTRRAGQVFRCVAACLARPSSPQSASLTSSPSPSLPPAFLPAPLTSSTEQQRPTRARTGASLPPLHERDGDTDLSTLARPQHPGGVLDQARSRVDARNCSQISLLGSEVRELREEERKRAREGEGGRGPCAGLPRALPSGLPGYRGVSGSSRATSLSGTTEGGPLWAALESFAVRH